MIWIIIIGMALVTFIPRVLPAFIMDSIKFPEWLEKWLKAIPYAALGALIFPGIMNTIPDKPWIGLVAGVIAITLAWLRVHILLVVLSAIGVVYSLQHFF
ncbi:branched-subunit amino acid transport protein [Gracilibacillus halotolerans]|uniref:Branched-subunit amino acid transport protein n=1 Tax=Gracilibacillus halotolerans TaxID=74386 RepID=A0A841RM36_9BACI|nr:AzlD domain-containing protein [Gracilibacillus halotolerans]MBB6512683.1 branched-subunit amino acid transport protein [Gracilibacillus halotolerans]